MAKGIFPRKCVVWFAEGKSNPLIQFPTEVMTDAMISVFTTTVVLPGPNVREMVKLVKAFAGTNPFSRLVIKGHSTMHLDAQGNPQKVTMHMGTDEVSSTSFPLFDIHFSELSKALDDDAEVEIVNCFVASDVKLHRLLARTIGRTVKAGVGETGVYGIWNEKAFKKCTKDGTIKAA